MYILKKIREFFHYFNDTNRYIILRGIKWFPEDDLKYKIFYDLYQNTIIYGFSYVSENSELVTFKDDVFKIDSILKEKNGKIIIGIKPHPCNKNPRSDVIYVDATKIKTITTMYNEVCDICIHNCIFVASIYDTLYNTFLYDLVNGEKLRLYYMDTWTDPDYYDCKFIKPSEEHLGIIVSPFNDEFNCHEELLSKISYVKMIN